MDIGRKIIFNSQNNIEILSVDCINDNKVYHDDKIDNIRYGLEYLCLWNENNKDKQEE